MNTTRHRWLVLVIVSMACLLVAIDMTVLYIALPALTRELQASSSEKLWIVNMYPLVIAGLLLGAGTLGNRIGHKRLFISGLFIFGVASLLAAFSSSSPMLIFARALLGVGAAAMMPTTLAIISSTFEDHNERSIAVAIWAVVVSGGAAVGPLIGGLLLEYFWWGAMFVINVPIVLIACWLSGRLIKNIKNDSAQPWDLIASLQIMVALISLVFAINEIARQVPSYEAVAVALVICISVALLFARRQRSESPLIDRQLFRNPVFCSAFLAGLMGAGCLVAINLVLSQRLQLVVGLSPLQAGLYFLPLSLGALVGGPLSGWFLLRFKNEGLLAFVLTLYAAGIAMFLLSFSYPIFLQMVCLLLLGVCFGACMTAASHTMMSAAGPEREGMAASFDDLTVQLGGALGIAIMGSLMSIVYSRTLSIPEDTLNAESARDGIDSAILMAEQFPGAVGDSLVMNAHQAFENSVFSVLAAAIIVLLVIAAWVRFNVSRAIKPAV
ncbi:Methyl viologen resistance protein SmvA [Pseudomonas fluorescens]|uniref:Methyl viologen resistance protein SmvA n=2 Tax=Pseudomonas fluorescens TaxID=294 RepID=A0A5E7T5B4_PSEFL|nr:Methyl viologen resistance protein SmvA [Pseudomonas fluorescens]